ncbi:MAG: PD40 domain-containing protein [Acidobacteriaceae bacterium]|nr:PD40 domain-containing protein [Acidobacteriaceae bacterium]
MRGSSSPNPIVRFGVFEVDLQQAELRRSGLRQKLGPQPFELLRTLLERPGELITRDELRQRLWPGNTFVDYELGLKKCVNRVREVLGDSADHPRYIETLPRRGYRFVATIQEGGAFAAGVESGAEKTSSPAINRQNDWNQADTTRKRLKKVLLAGLLAAVIAIISTWPFRSHGRYRSEERKAPPAEITLLPLTSIEGEQRLPAFSPDGSRVVFMLSARVPNESGLYAAVVGSQSLLRLAQGEDAYSPAWSPDGREVGFLRNRGDKFLIVTVPALGGAEKTIYAGPRSPFIYETGEGGLSFSPDGRLLAFSEWNAAIQRSSIKVLSLQDFSTRFLTSRPTACHDRRPAFSIGGDRVAFVRSSGPTAVEEVFVISAAGGEPTQLTFDHKQIFGPPGWTRSDEIIFSSSRGGLPSIWRVTASGGVPQRVPGAGPGAWYPSVSLSGGELAYEYVDEEENLWRLELSDGIHTWAPASILVSSSKTKNLLPQFSPDARRIAFQSQRSGYPEVWICNSNGSNPVQVTDLRAFAGSPGWSPDGRYIVFDYRARERSDIYVVETGGGHPHPVVAMPDADSFLPSWSRDGRWIYFTCNRGEKPYQIWKQAVKDGAAAAPMPIQVTRGGGFGAVETVDGKLLLYTKRSSQGIWAIPPDGGSETAIWSGPGPDNWSNWAVAKRGIYFFAPEPGRPPKIEYLQFKTKRLSQIGRLGKPSFYGLAVSPKDGSLLYSQLDRTERQILLMEHFR